MTPARDDQPSPPPPHTAPPPTPAEAADAARLFALLDTWAAELGVPVKDVGPEVTRAIDRWPGEPKAREVWIGSPFSPAPLEGAPRRAPTRRALVAALWERWNTGALDGDLAACDPYGLQWSTGPGDRVRWPAAYLYVSRLWLRGVLEAAGLPVPACLAEAVTAPDVVRLVDLVPRWATETGGELAEIAADLGRSFFTPTPKWAEALAADADRCAARADAAKASVAAGTLPAWEADVEARLAARARAAATEAEARAAAPPAAEPTLDEVWVADDSLGPRPKASQYHVRRTDLATYFTWLATAAGPTPAAPVGSVGNAILRLRARRAAAGRRRATPVPPWLGPEDPDKLYNPERVWLSTAWLRREFAERRGGLPAFLAAADQAPQPWPGFPNPPRRRRHGWFRAIEAATKALWATRGAWPTPDEIWTALMTAPPAGYPVREHPGMPRTLLMLGDRAEVALEVGKRARRHALTRRAFEAALKRWMVPPSGRRRPARPPP